MRGVKSSGQLGTYHAQSSHGAPKSRLRGKGIRLYILHLVHESTQHKKKSQKCVGNMRGGGLLFHNTDKKSKLRYTTSSLSTGIFLPRTTVHLQYGINLWCWRQGKNSVLQESHFSKRRHPKKKQEGHRSGAPSLTAPPPAPPPSTPPLPLKGPQRYAIAFNTHRSP